MTLSALLEVVYRFYPRGVSIFSPGYKETPEYLRRADATRRATAEYPMWEAMVRRLGARYRFHDCSLHLFTGVDSAYTLRLSIPGKEEEYDSYQIRFGCNVSFLGPYYLVRHRGGILHEEPHVSGVAREIEATYTGYEPIPAKLGNLVVPDVDLDTLGMGAVTIYNCLLSTDWGT